MNEAHDLHSVSDWLAESARPLLVSHRRPDGDALGSLAAVAHGLRQRGASPIVALFEPYPERYGIMRSTCEWHLWDDMKDIAADDCDGVVIVDTCAASQLEPIGPYLAMAPRTLVLDHHTTRDPIGTRDGDLRYFDEVAGATALIAYEWLRGCGVELNREIATALYIGIATDSGWFRFSNTDVRLMQAATDLVGLGVDPNAVYNAIYQQDSHAKLRLIARVLESMEILGDGRLAVMQLRPEDFRITGADDSMTADLINEATRLAGTEATLMITQESESTIRVNLRSKSTLDVSELARRFGGGGHARAAGARLNGAWDYVVPRLIDETLAAL